MADHGTPGSPRRGRARGDIGGLQTQPFLERPSPVRKRRDCRLDAGQLGAQWIRKGVGHTGVLPLERGRPHESEKPIMPTPSTGARPAMSARWARAGSEPPAKPTALMRRPATVVIDSRPLCGPRLRERSMSIPRREQSPAS